MCEIFIKGENPTNLKVHLKSSQKKANLAYLEGKRSTPNPHAQQQKLTPGKAMSSGPAVFPLFMAALTSSLVILCLSFKGGSTPSTFKGHSSLLLDHPNLLHNTSSSISLLSQLIKVLFSFLSV